MKITIYVEGGGDSKYTQRFCSQGFGKLLEKAGFMGKMPRIIACGGRGAAFGDFRTALEAQEPTKYPILLVDSEDQIEKNITPWQHLKNREKNWIIPKHVSDNQAQLMVTCMETWIMADRAALSNFFGAELQNNSLLSEYDLEQYDRHDVQDALAHATRNCGKNRPYKKGERSFDVLETLNPNTLKQRLPHFKRFIETLEALLK